MKMKMKIPMQRFYFEILDNIIREFDDRFFNNSELLTAIECIDDLNFENVDIFKKCI